MIKLQMEPLVYLHELFFSGQLLSWGTTHQVKCCFLAFLCGLRCLAFFFSQGYIYSMQLVTKGTGESQVLMIFYWAGRNEAFVRIFLRNQGG